MGNAIRRHGIEQPDKLALDTAWRFAGGIQPLLQQSFGDGLMDAVSGRRSTPAEPKGIQVHPNQFLGTGRGNNIVDRLVDSGPSSYSESRL